MPDIFYKNPDANNHFIVLLKFYMTIIDIDVFLDSYFELGYKNGWKEISELPLYYSQL